MAVKIFGAERKPNGSLESTYIWSFQHMPNHILSKGETGTNLYADFISILANSEPFPIVIAL